VRHLLVSLAVLAVASAAAAEPFPIHYLVGYKALKANVDSTQTLTFDFFDDSACTSSIGSVTLSTRPIPASCTRRSRASA
jgi:hypothetical protein